MPLLRMSSPQPFPANIQKPQTTFLDLPAKIRGSIYEQLFRGIALVIDPFSSVVRPCNTIWANRQTRAEATPNYYQPVTFERDYP